VESSLSFLYKPTTLLQPEQQAGLVVDPAVYGDFGFSAQTFSNRVSIPLYSFSSNPSTTVQADYAPLPYLPEIPTEPRLVVTSFKCPFDECGETFGSEAQ
jgi:hypothetical protein